MEAYAAKYAWMPPVSSGAKRVQRALLPFSPAINGWTIWYEGKTRTVCGIIVLWKMYQNAGQN